tara:strand:- start:1406 stop:2701 length:1296 start_codon:yes stop_codon:yes gene_type:complete
LVEEIISEKPPKGLGEREGKKIEISDLRITSDKQERFFTEIQELDRVFGGGLVPGSAILVAGDPGIGKSTLLLQAIAAVSKFNKSVIYVSGEEGKEQIRLRAKRLNLDESSVKLATATDVRNILSSLKANPTEVVVIDSIQTMYLDTLDASPGSVSQVRAAAQEFIRYGKESGTVILLVGHVTKDGQIAGPRILEHMVDTVLYFEGDRGHQFRIVRSIKNRFGPADEIGVFEMTSQGLTEVKNPSSVFLNGLKAPPYGTVVFAGIEGTRPVLMEIQALVSPGGAGNPRRAVLGWDSNRLSMILAVLERNTGHSFLTNDIYLNVVGGLKIKEPAADLAIAAAIMSSINSVPLNPETVVFGEIGLSGEIRPIAQSSTRLKEAKKLGFINAIVPSRTTDKKLTGISGVKIKSINQITELPSLFKIQTTKQEMHD